MGSRTIGQGTLCLLGASRPSRPDTIVLLLIVLLSAAAGAAGRESDALADVIVTSTPLPSTPGQLGRSVEVLGTNDMRSARSASIPELLAARSSVGVRARGNGSVQADVSLRGSTFQQVLLTLDGLPITDAQTAHHNMNLPFPPGALGRIVVIPGPGSALFGPAAFAGVIDLAPRRPTRTGARLAAAAGSFDTYRTEGAADLADERAATALAASYEESEGFTDGTDYAAWSAWSSSYLPFDAGALRISLGHADRDFGARDFYAAYPSRERTRATLVDLAPRFEPAPGWLLTAIARYRRHEDEFILTEEDPSLYRNDHRSDTFTERVTVRAPRHALGTTAAGLERADTALDSSNLGEHDSATSAAFVQHRVYVGTGTADLGLRVDDHSEWDTEVSPSASLAMPVGEGLTWHASAARGIRPPSFTERYYVDPANTGNAALQPEEAWGGETGLAFRGRDRTRASLTYFIRDTRNLIDWVRPGEEAPWQATNIGTAAFQGGELALAGGSRWCDWHAAYRYTDVDPASGGLESKYALNVARHDLRVTLGLPETRGFTASVSARYRDVPTLDRAWLLTSRVAQRIGRVTLFTRGRNLLDETYEEIPGVPTAGRYLEIGAEVTL